MRQVSLPAAAAMALAALSTLGCSSSGTWKPVPVSIIPAAPPPGGPSRFGGKPAKAPAKPATDDESKAPAPAPIPGDLPSGLAPKMAVSELCKAKTCELAGLYPAAARPEAGSPAAAWGQRFAEAGQRLVTERDGRVDVYGLVLRGQVKVRGVEEGASKTLGPWGLFRGPGGALSVEATKPDSEVVLVVVTDGGPLEKLAGKPERWKARPKPVEVRELSAAKDLAWGGGAMHARLGFEGEGQRASVGVLLASPDAAVAPHQHDTSWEILTALEAEGTLQVGPEDGTPRAVAGGQTTMVPRGVRHAWVPGHKKPLVGLQVYVPPGPEQRFKTLATPAN